MKLYKALKKGGYSCNGGTARWSLPKKVKGKWKAGKWMPAIKGELEPCANGYHLCRRKDLIRWLSETIYEAEYRGEIVKDDNKVVVRECRLLRKLEAWDETSARLFACDCAERVLPIFENQIPEDARPRKAIDVTRRYAIGGATKDEMAAAWNAAWDAAARAARDAWDAAAWAAARDAELKWQTKRLFKLLEG